MSKDKNVATNILKTYMYLLIFLSEVLSDTLDVLANTESEVVVFFCCCCFFCLFFLFFVFFVLFFFFSV